MSDTRGPAAQSPAASPRPFSASAHGRPPTPRGLQCRSRGAEVGYRLTDTATLLRKRCGDRPPIRESGLSRADVFVTGQEAISPTENGEPSSWCISASTKTGQTLIETAGPA
jgi:hypothetical protein